ncbi:MAG: HlyD family secretion protein [Candidatus Omnitrophica bacterium]|nr:HlyD family secretion protein [Candidatus Omnitrophota bacterium]
MKTLKNILIFIFVLAVISGFLAVYVFRNVVYITTDDAYIDGRIYTVASKIPGTVKSVPLDDNQLVKKSDLLVEIDPVDYEVKVNEAQAALTAQESQVANAQALLNSALANLEIQQATFKQAGLDLQRAERLVKEGALAQEKLDHAKTAFTLAQAQIKAANEQIAQGKTALDLAAAVVKQREANLRTAQLNLEYTKIYAPADGHVTKKSVEAGNQIQAGQPLMAVVSVNDIWVVANYKETQLKNIHPGQKVLINVDTYPHKVFPGKVDSIMAGTGAVFSLFPPENALGSYVKIVQRVPVKIIFDNLNQDKNILRVGMSVIPKIVTRDE